MGLIYHLNKGSDKLVEKCKTKEKRFGLLGVVNCGKINIWGSKWDRIVISGRFVCVDLSRCHFLSPMTRAVLLLVQERGGGTPLRRKNCILLIDREWAESSFCVCCFLIVFHSKQLLCPNGLFWVAYLGPLHMIRVHSIS